MRRAALVLAAVTFIVACDDRSTVTAPQSPPSTPAARGISDGAHDDGVNASNDDFFFLPPVVPYPKVLAFGDRPFHPGLEPRVDICRVDVQGVACEATIVSFPSRQLTISTTDASYGVNWDTKSQVLDPDRIYRITVAVGQKELGYADLWVAATGSALRNVDTDEFIPLVDGRTLPIRFRIEEGALCEFKPCTEVVVRNATGGTFHAPDGLAAISIPQNALPVDQVVLTIERKPVPPGGLCIADPLTPGFVFVQYEGCYTLETDPSLATTTPIGFQEPVRVGVCMEPDVPEPLEAHLVLFKFDEGLGIQRKPSVDVSDFLTCPEEEIIGSGTGTTTFLGRARSGLAAFAGLLGRVVAPRAAWAVDGGLGTVIPRGEYLSTFFWGLPVTIAPADALELQALVGTAVPRSPTFLVRTEHPDDEGVHDNVHLAPVRLQPDEDGGLLRDAAGVVQPFADVKTDEQGIARLPDGWVWQLGTTPGTYALVASGPFENGPATVTAQAIAPDLAIASLTYAPTAITAVSPIVFTVQVDNTGDAPSTAGTLVIVPFAGADPQSFDIAPLAPGEHQIVTSTAQLAPVGSHTVTATVQPDQAVPDAGNNNSLTVTYQVTDPADLQILSFAVLPESPIAGREVEFRVRLVNRGGTSSPQVRGHISVAGSSITPLFFFVPPLAPGAESDEFALATLLPAGQYQLNVVIDDDNRVLEAVETNNHLVTPLVVSALGSVAGTVVDQNTGAALSGATVQLSHYSVPQTFTATTDANGAFTIADLPPAPYQYVVDGPAGYGDAVGSVPVVAGVQSELAIELAPFGSLSGTVMDASTREPLASVSVAIVGTQRGTITNSDGRYIFQNVSPGTYIVRASLPNYATLEQQVTIGSAAITLDFRLQALFPVIDLSPESPLLIDAIAGGAVAQRDVTINNGGAGSFEGLSVQFTYPPALVCDTCVPPTIVGVTLDQSVSPAVVRVNVRVDETYKPGDYSFLFSVSSTNSLNGPVSYPFTIRVHPAGTITPINPINPGDGTVVPGTP